MYGEDSAQALSRAKLLLKRRMVLKAVESPDIKPEDTDELHRYAVFITEPHNLAKDLTMEQEINHSQNIRMITAK